MLNPLLKKNTLRTASVMLHLMALPANAVADSGLGYVNDLRSSAGLPTLSVDEKLARAAARHAAYLDVNRPPGTVNRAISAHAESPHMRKFSGENPSVRALGAGYNHGLVRENVSIGYTDIHAAVDGLMGAIYHRLTFLDPLLSEAGVGMAGKAQVFLMGRRDVEALCFDPPVAALAKPGIDCLGTKMTQEHYSRMCASITPAERFSRPFEHGCSSGQRLSASFMNRLCKWPPPGVMLHGAGRYYDVCADGRKFRADWFEGFCRALPAGAAYQFSGAYYRICDDKIQVHAEWMAQACKNLPDEARDRDSGRYRQICAAPHDIRVEFLDELDSARRNAGPGVVMWPADGISGVPPAFFDEEPDPLPDRGVSGYPVSIQVNPARYERVQLLSFQIYAANEDHWQAIGHVRLLDHRTDPNKLLDGHTFALFPMKRLDWGTEYVVVAELLLDGQVRRLEWGFRTADLDMPQFKLDRDLESFEIAADTDYAMYVTPRPGQAATVASVTTERRKRTKVDIEVLDPNTLRVRALPHGCDRIRLTFGDDREAVLIPIGCGRSAH